mmetsp:Transcript_9494/g.17328  ORF Transcript_9494/g.17328 Transcript_9494/m.17328 type:complete len:337 (+) Transcript_9494:303-1313(+)
MSILRINIINKLVILPRSVVERHTSGAQGVAARTRLVLTLGHPVHFGIHLHQIASISRQNLPLSRVSELASTPRSPQVVDGFQVLIRQPGHLCKVHPAPRFRAFSRDVDELLPSPVVRLPELARPQKLSQRRVIFVHFRLERDVIQRRHARDHGRLVALRLRSCRGLCLLRCSCRHFLLCDALFLHLLGSESLSFGFSLSLSLRGCFRLEAPVAGLFPRRRLLLDLSLHLGFHFRCHGRCDLCLCLFQASGLLAGGFGLKLLLTLNESRVAGEDHGVDHHAVVVDLVCPENDDLLALYWLRRRQWSEVWYFRKWIFLVAKGLEFVHLWIRVGIGEE